MEHFFGDYSDPGDDIGAFASSLNSAIDGIQAQDDALIAQYGHPADPATDPGGLPADTAPHVGALDSSDQAFLTQLGNASLGALPDGTSAWADNLNNEVNAMQDHTDAAITNAEHSPGFGQASPNAAAALNAFGVADGIGASTYQDVENQLAQTETDSVLQDGDSALTDAQVAVAAPDGSADE
jgi:hypothetical protein